ncbi:hypothetical protein ACSSS7_001620 [Eimeria intestinalis]
MASQTQSPTGDTEGGGQGRGEESNTHSKTDTQQQRGLHTRQRSSSSSSSNNNNNINNNSSSSSSSVSHGGKGKLLEANDLREKQRHHFPMSFAEAKALSASSPTPRKHAIQHHPQDSTHEAAAATDAAKTIVGTGRSSGSSNNRSRGEASGWQQR